MSIVAVLLLLAGLAVLARYARHDRFAGPRNLHVDLDDLGAVPDHNLVRLH